MIRPARPEDAEAIAAIYAPIVTETAISFEEMAPSPDEIRRRIVRVSERLPFLAAESGGILVGYAYAHSHRERAAYRFSVDVTIYVAAGARGIGTGRALYSDLLQRLRELGLHRAYAGIALPNEASVRFHEALAFSHVGTFREVGYKFGRWHDVGWWERDLSRV